MLVITGDQPAAPMRAMLLVEASRLRSLAIDLDLLAAGVAPIERFLEQSPVLENWMVGVHQVPCLRGVATRAPLGHDGSITTTPVVAIHPAAGWARTTTGFYGLGQSALPSGGVAREGELGHG